MPSLHRHAGSSPTRRGLWHHLAEEIAKLELGFEQRSLPTVPVGCLSRLCGPAGASVAARPSSSTGPDPVFLDGFGIRHPGTLRSRLLTFTARTQGPAIWRSLSTKRHAENHSSRNRSNDSAARRWQRRPPGADHLVTASRRSKRRDDYEHTPGSWRRVLSRRGLPTAAGSHLHIVKKYGWCRGG